MNEWTRGDILALIGLIVAIISCVVAILAIPPLRRLFGLGGKDLWIHTPKNKDNIFMIHGESKPILRPISGQISGYHEREIERLGLFVEVLIKTDKWYPQGNAPVADDGKWTLKDARFGGSVHIIRAILKDRHNREHQSASIEVHLS